MQSRYFEFGEDTIVRADQYAQTAFRFISRACDLTRIQIHPPYIRPSSADRMAFFSDADQRDQLGGQQYPGIGMRENELLAD